MKYIPYAKLSKKARKAEDSRNRVTWDLSPVTRRPEKPRAYNRAKTRREERKRFSTVSLLLLGQA